MLENQPPDVLVVRVALPSPYPSVNHTVRDGVARGRKSPSYRALFENLELAARAEIARTGWRKASTPVRCWLTRYCPHRRRSDASNLGKCEFDSLTRAGVWEDDSLARPLTLDVLFDPGGIDRVLIVVQRIGAEIPAAAAKVEAERKDKPAGQEVYSTDEFRSMVKQGKIRGARL